MDESRVSTLIHRIESQRDIASYTHTEFLGEVGSGFTPEFLTNQHGIEEQGISQEMRSQSSVRMNHEKDIVYKIQII